MAKAKKPVDPVTAYARSVVAGETPAGNLVVMACARHLRDLKGAAARGLYFDEAAAQRGVEFFRFCRHVEGEWAGRPLTLGAWQIFVIGSLWGWRRADGTRRFRTAYVEVPRKNGKSTLAAGVALNLMIADNEPGAQVYSAATKRDQAKIVFNTAKRMVQLSPPLRRRVGIKTLELGFAPSGATFQPLSSDSRTLDGLNVHGAVLDEVHAYGGRDIVDVIETGTGARRQPLIFEITTAGQDQNTICWEHHEYSAMLLENEWCDAAADSWFAYITGIDKGDDWTKEATWIKANPGYGTAPKADYMRELAGKAERSTGAQMAFRQKHLDEWMQLAIRWLNMDEYAAGAAPFDEEDLRGRTCYLGLDLAKVNDLSAAAYLFPPLERKGLWYAIVDFWCPEDDIDARTKRDRVPYKGWCEQDWITATPGNATDFDFIEASILEKSEFFEIAEIVYDPAFSYELITHLQKAGFKCIKMRQGHLSLAAPTEELQRLVKTSQLQHGGNPVLSWMAGNTVVRRNVQADVIPDKAKSREKIDGISALVNAMARAMNRPVKRKSIYAQQRERDAAQRAEQEAGTIEAPT